MESKEIIKILNEIEEKFPVDKWSVDDLDIWPYVRFRIGSKLSESKSPSQKNVLYERYIKNLYKYYKNNLKNWLKNKDKNVDFLFVENGVHIADIKGKYYFTRTDPLRDKIEKSGYKCKTIIGGYKVETPLYNTGEFFQFSLDMMFVLDKVKTYFKKPLLLNYKLESYSEFINFLKQNNIYSEELELKNLLGQVSRIKRIEKYFTKRLKKLKPKAVFILCYYSTYGFALVSSCKKLSIPVIDIQHGVQGDLHYAYGSYKRVPKNGFNLHPDIFYVWSDEEKSSLLKWIKGNTKVFVGGNNFLEMWKDDGNEIVQYYTNMLKEKYLISKYSKVILYTVDPQNNRDKEIIKAIQNSPSDWFWFVRVHPKRVGMLEYTRKRIGDTKCGFAIDNIHLLPLYSFFKVCDVHITERSSTIIEAANFGIKSIVTSKYTLERFEKYVDSGMAVYGSSWKEVLKYIKRFKKGDNIKKRKEVNTLELIKMIEEI